MMIIITIYLFICDFWCNACDAELNWLSHKLKNKVEWIPLKPLDNECITADFFINRDLEYVIYEVVTGGSKVVRSNSFVWDRLSPDTEYTFKININKIPTPSVEMPGPVKTITARTKACSGRIYTCIYITHIHVPTIRGAPISEILAVWMFSSQSEY